MRYCVCLFLILFTTPIFGTHAPIKRCWLAFFELIHPRSEIPHMIKASIAYNLNKYGKRPSKQSDRDDLCDPTDTEDENSDND